MESERNFIPKPEKPPVLFHASSSSNIEIFEPRAEKTRDKNEGPRVFATPSRAMASIFLIESDDNWVQSGTMDDVPYIVISDEERFRSLDKGGVIYTLPNDTFDNDPEKGSGELEWTSTESVVPTDTEFISSAIEDMLNQGVKIYFVDANLYQDMQTASDYGKSILDKLTPYSS